MCLLSLTEDDLMHLCKHKEYNCSGVLNNFSNALILVIGNYFVASSLQVCVQLCLINAHDTLFATYNSSINLCMTQLDEND